MTWRTSTKKFLKQLDSLRPIIKGLGRGLSEFVVEGTNNSIDNAVVAGLDEVLDELPSITDVIIPFVDSITEPGQMQVFNTIKALWDQSGMSHQVANKAFNKSVLNTFKDRMEHELRVNSAFFDEMYQASHNFPKFIDKADKAVKDVANQIIEGGQEIMNTIKQHAPIKPKSKPEKSGGGRSRSTKGKQHPQWYLRNPFNLHTTVNLNNNKSVVLNVKEIIDSKDGHFSVPGTIIYYTQTMEPVDPNKGFRKAVEQLYSTLNITQLGSISYTVDDLAKYLTFGTHCWTTYFELTRAIRLSSTYLAYDATIQTVFNEFRISDRELASVANLTINFGNWIYTALPMQGTILDRRELLYSNVFRDSNSLNSQFFMFKNESSVAYTGGYTEYPNASIGETSTANLINELKSIYDDNPNFAIIAGHLIRLYGDAVNNSKFLDKLIKDRNPAYIKISPLDFVYDEDIIDQVRNATIDTAYTDYDAATNCYAMDYEDNVDALRAQSLNMDVMLGVTHLNSLVPGKPESLYRFRHHVRDVSMVESSYIAKVDACGTEHIIGADFWYQTNPDVSTLELSSKRISPTYNTSVAGVLPYTPIAAVAFEAFPLVLCVDAYGEDASIRVFGVLAAYNNTILLQYYTFIQAISNGNNSLWYCDMQYKQQNNLISFIK